MGLLSHYKSNLRDIEFNLFELFKLEEKLGQGAFENIDAETARSILAEVERLSTEDLAASFVDSDRNPPVYDPKTYTAPLPESFKKSLAAWDDAEFWRLGLPEGMGGTMAPSSFTWALGEMVMGANPSIFMYGVAPMFASVIWANGNERGGTAGCGANFNTTAPPATAKNPIQIGATNAGNDASSNFSGWGPTDDGRRKK